MLIPSRPRPSEHADGWRTERCRRRKGRLPGRPFFLPPRGRSRVGPLHRAPLADVSRQLARARADGGSMASFSRRIGLFGSSMYLALLAHAVRAASPDPRTLRDQLEDQLLDGDRDAEDLTVFHEGQQGQPSHHGGHAYVALQAFAADVPGGRELGAFVVLQLPFDRFVSSARPASAGVQGVEIANATGPAELAPVAG